MKYRAYCQTVSDMLERIETDLNARKKIQVDEGFARLIEVSKNIRRAKRQVYLIGNGASASMASHMALDMWKNLKIKAAAFNDLVSLTATSNDFSYEDVFKRPLEFFGVKGDMLVCISSSGNSPNIVGAARLARQKGLFVVTFSAMSRTNKLRRLGHLNFYVPAQTYGHAEVSHQTLLHYWVDGLLPGNKIKPSKEGRRR